VPEAELIPEPPFVIAFPAPRAVERAESVVNVTMVVESWEFVPDAGTMVVIVTGCTSSLVKVILATGRSLWPMDVVAACTTEEVGREGDKLVMVETILGVVNNSEEKWSGGATSVIGLVGSTLDIRTVGDDGEGTGSVVSCEV
jgi:hypothetical protein